MRQRGVARAVSGLKLSEVVAAIDGRVVCGRPQADVGGVTTDSRTAAPGELFFALRGPRFDGHDFVTDATRRGAVGAVVAAERAASLAASLAAADARGTLIAVDDPLAALGRLAAFHRRRLSARVIAVVGSNGKTTTKALIDHLLSGQLRGRASPRSFNNAIGVPLTLLSARPDDEYLVVEIGTNRPGEVRELAALVQPEIAVVTSIGREHLEGLGDLAGVAAEECSVLAHLPPGGYAVVNVDWPEIWAHLPRRMLAMTTFGSSAAADLRISAVRYEPPWLRFVLNGRCGYRLRLVGAHNAWNAAAAIAVARHFGMRQREIAARLESFAPLPGRGELLELGGVTVLNDSYNANPDSVQAALAAFAALPVVGQRVVVLGEMRELGARSGELHAELARQLRDSAVDRVLLVGAAGELMGSVLAGTPLFDPRRDRCPTVAACARRLLELLRPGDAVLLKASRAVGLECLLQPLRAVPGGAPLPIG